MTFWGTYVVIQFSHQTSALGAKPPWKMASDSNFKTFTAFPVLGWPSWDFLPHMLPAGHFPAFGPICGSSDYWVVWPKTACSIQCTISAFKCLFKDVQGLVTKKVVLKVRFEGHLHWISHTCKTYLQTYLPLGTFFVTGPCGLKIYQQVFGWS